MILFETVDKSAVRNNPELSLPPQFHIVNKKYKLKFRKRVGKSVNTKWDREKGDFISSFYQTERWLLNHYVSSKHFKMKSLNNVFKISKKGVWVA